jgi:hypothetical protein
MIRSAWLSACCRRQSLVTKAVWLVSFLVLCTELDAQGIRHCPCHECRAYRLGHHDPTQKGGRPESGPEQEQPQGYAAPQPTGVMAGPTQGIGFEGCEIELPTLKIRTPSIRIPALTRYHHPARMLINSSVAPLVQDFRREFSVESGEEQAPVGNPRPEGGEDDEPQQKRGYHHQARHEQPPAHGMDDRMRRHLSPHDGSAHSANVAADRQWQEMLASKRALEERLDQLQQMLELLVLQQTMRHPITPHGASNPDAPSRAVQPSHFVMEMPATEPFAARTATVTPNVGYVSVAQQTAAVQANWGGRHVPAVGSGNLAWAIENRAGAVQPFSSPATPRRLPQTDSAASAGLRRTPPVSAIYR